MRFNSRDLTLMTLLGCLSALTTLTTNMIPAPLPGLYGAISIPLGTILVFTARALVDKPGAATFTQLVSGVVSTILPGGPPIPWLIIPVWTLGGIVVDLASLSLDFSESIMASLLVGLIYGVPGDLLLYYAFRVILGWFMPPVFFLYGFLLIHSLLGGIGGLLSPSIIKRLRPLLS